MRSTALKRRGPNPTSPGAVIILIKIAPGSNPRIENLAAGMRTAGITVDDHMLYTIFVDALPAEYVVEARNFVHLVTVSAAMTSRLYESGSTDVLETGGRSLTLAMPAMLCSPAAAVVAVERAAATVPTGKVEAAAKGKGDVGYSKDKAVKTLTRTVVARPRLPAAI